MLNKKKSNKQKAKQHASDSDPSDDDSSPLSSNNGSSSLLYCQTQKLQVLWTHFTMAIVIVTTTGGMDLVITMAIEGISMVSYQADSSNSI